MRSAEDIPHWRARYAAELARLADSRISLSDPAVEVGASYFFLTYHGLPNRDLNRQLADIYGRACSSLLWSAPHCARARKPGRTRVGFISRFMLKHSIGMDAFTYFLAFARLAPVQCVSYGHPDTTGIANLDYWVSNDLFEPDDAAEHYSERLFLLKDLGTTAYYYRPQLVPPAKRCEDFGLPGDATLYLCPQSLFKFHPEFDAMLAGILRGDPRARLVLIEGRAKHWGQVLATRFESAFPDVARRVIFLPQQSPADFTRLIAACDVMLDTPHFNGMTTSLEAFALGMPVVTLPSGLQRGRHTTGMYRKMQWMELVARDGDDYVRIALELGKERDRREQARQEILTRSDALFEDRRAVQEFERFFREALEKAC